VALEAKLVEVKQSATIAIHSDLAKSKELTHKVVQGVRDDRRRIGHHEIRDASRAVDKANAQSEIDASRLEKQVADALEQMNSTPNWPSARAAWAWAEGSHGDTKNWTGFTR
jgi:hypothetical protein